MKFSELSNESKANAVVNFKAAYNQKNPFDQMTLAEAYDYVANHRTFATYDLNGNETNS